jgi:hypothetical protein
MERGARVLMNLCNIIGRRGTKYFVNPCLTILLKIYLQIKGKVNVKLPL